jgi:hypothetical protein
VEEEVELDLSKLQVLQQQQEQLILEVGEVVVMDNKELQLLQ